jgi:hypothetical protein
VTIQTTIANNSDVVKTLPLQWNQYAWDSMNKDNLRFTNTEVVTLAPSEIKTVTYRVQSQRESVIYVTATTQDLEVKSILNIRYVRDNIEETRINFPSLDTFPLTKNQEATLFACAHSTNQPNVPGNILKLTLSDKDEHIIHEYRYEGDINGAMSGFGDTFKPEKNINYAVLTATLERNGVIVEQVIQTYDCAAIDKDSCLPEEATPQSSFIDFLTWRHIILLVGVVLILLIASTLFFMRKKRRKNLNTEEDIIMTVPTAL